MKKVVLLLALILTASAGFSQQRKRKGQANSMTPEQRRTLAVKKLTFQLDLNKSQSKKVAALMKDLSSKRMASTKAQREDAVAQREKMMELKKGSTDTADFKRKIRQAVADGELDREAMMRLRKRGFDTSFQTKNNSLDRMIDMQRGMKDILSETQFNTYKKLQQRRINGAKMRVKKEKMEKRFKRERS
jgi:hypothetical protein